jgi:FtsH-binding integral membrane protein
MQANTGVFSRSGQDNVSTRVFFLVLGIVLAYGLGGTAILAKMFADLQVGWMHFIFLGLVIPIIGIIIAVMSSNPLLSFIGYNMISLSFGVILGPVINQYSPDLIFRAFLITLEVTIIMAGTGIMFPNIYRHIGGALFMALLGLVIIRIAQLFIPGMQQLGIIDWISAGIFSLYIGYDMHRAMEVPKTIDNAVDIALDLYLDIINLFLDILKILSSSSGNGGDSSGSSDD